MESDISKKGEHKLFIPNHVLQNYGCKYCVWKNYGMCPKGFTDPEQSLDEGYCQEMADFLFSLAGNDSSISVLKEKFILYTQEIEAMANNMEYHRLSKEYHQKKKDGYSEERLSELKNGILIYRLWWEGLTNSITKGLSRINDREARSKDSSQTNSKITIENFNVLLKEADANLKQLDSK